MSFKVNGNRLKTARTYRGLTLAELGEKIDLSKQILSLYENEKSTPDFSTIIKLSDALHFPREFFLKMDNTIINSGTTYFRALTSTTKKSRNSESSKVEFIACLYKELYKVVDFPELNIPNIDISDDLKDDEIENVASIIRKFWGLSENPIDDLQYIFEKNGFVVIGSKLQDRKIDAYSQRVSIDGNDTYIIVLSIGQKPKARINFDLAHELGHILLHPWTEDIETLSSDEFKERERQANKFASCFLLPKKLFAKDCLLYVNELEYYISLKKKWNVSIQAMLYRANDLGLISNNQFQYLMRKISQNGWRKKEPLDFPHALNENIFKVAIDLLLNNGYSKKEVVKILENSSVLLFSDEIEELLNLPKDYLKTYEKKEDKIIQIKMNIK